jgi:hypothetical protein
MGACAEAVRGRGTVRRALRSDARTAGGLVTLKTHDPIYLGQTSVRILVPSRRDDGAIVDAELRREWEARARKQLETKPFGGASPSTEVGSYVHGDGRVTREEVTILQSSCGTNQLADLEAQTRIFGFAAEMCAALGQETIFVGWGDMAFLIMRDFIRDQVPVRRFSELTKDSQTKHITLGWGGITRPSRVLQVLSLDGWTMPKPDATTEKAEEQKKDEETAKDEKKKEEEEEQKVPLVRRAVLHEDGRTRSAWSWVPGQGETIKQAVKAWRQSSEPAPGPGDLVFLRSDTAAIGIAYIDERGQVRGPRDLRTSHGRLNPVTRQLLDRILLRDWDGLAEDLDRKTISNVFFPKLQGLQKKIEQTFARTVGEREAFRYSVLVVGRMVFVRFLAQKGWLPGDVEGMREAYRRSVESGTPFYDAYVKPLWFDVLNVPEAERPAVTQAAFAGESPYPYLNGGLFQPRPKERGLTLDDALFDPAVEGSFLWLFQEFEFSLNEYAGSDDSLRVDPSLFGQILETFNSVSEKKSDGVHYTPKAIARALALESILEALAVRTGIARAKLDRLAKGERSAVSGAEAEHLANALDALRIVDPAVGSGVLLWAALEVLLTLDSLCLGIQCHSDGYHRGSHMWGRRSRHFVCNCLYGVDISEEGVELTRLRLWLAVALSEDVPKPLPDLGLNITCSDSLRPLTTGTNAETGTLAFTDREDLVRKLLDVTHHYNKAGESDPARQHRMREEVLEIRRQLMVTEPGESQEALPFDWKLYFPHVFEGENGGFDVVIANPPYVRVQLQRSPQREAYLAAWKTLRTGNADLSYAFVELALRRLARPAGGQVAFIQPNFRHHDAAQATRDMLVGRDPEVGAALRLWVDFGDEQVFPTATNYVSMIFAERRVTPGAQAAFTYSNPIADAWQDADDIDWLRPPLRVHEHPTDREWLTIPRELRDRVWDARARMPRTLKELAKITVGIQTSCDAQYLFEDLVVVRDGVVEARPRGDERRVMLEAAMLRPCRKGSSATEFHVFFPYGSDEALLDEKTLSAQFPLAWTYLRSLRKTLEGREKGKFKGPGWYRFGRPQGVHACLQPKLLVPSMLRTMEVIADPEGRLAFTASGKGGGGAWAILPRDPQTSLATLAAHLRTPEAWDHILAYGSPQRDGWRGVDSEVLEGVPCRELEDSGA